MFFVAGIKTTTAAVVLLILAVLGLAAAHALLVAALPNGQRWLREGTSGVFLVLVATIPGEFLDVQSEAWLAVLCSTLLLWGAIEYQRGPRPAATAALPIGATVGTLTHAGL